nr:aminodeoxychorismate/anthranilate synthase component II [Brevibacterium renqingii]
MLIDNADSFTLNIFHLLAEVNECAPTLVPNDWAEFELSVLDEFENVVLSPGPGTPERPADFGICAEVVEHSQISVLGVRLGHQGIAHVHGGAVVHAPEPRHGRVSQISNTGTELFAGVPTPFSAVRYHSLAVTDLPDCLEVTAWSEDGVIQALRHRTRPQWGVQFHPESIASEQSRTLLQNFADLTVAWNRRDQHKNDLPASEKWVGKDAASDDDIPAGTLAAFDRSHMTTSRFDAGNHYILDSDALPQKVDFRDSAPCGIGPNQAWARNGSRPHGDAFRLGSWRAWLETVIVPPRS